MATSVPASYSRFPLESFDPRYKNIWLEALVKEVKITFATEKEAQTFQIRLHMYRSKLSKSGDTTGRLLYRAKTSRKDNVLFIRPADKKYEDILGHFNAPSVVEDTPSSVSSSTPMPSSTTEAFDDEHPFTEEELFAEFDKFK